MNIVHCEQGSDEWFETRLGKPSASRYKEILTPAELKPSKSASGYMNELVAERITGQKIESYKSKSMEVGSEREEESRRMYEFVTDVTVEQVGCIIEPNGRYLCSPDGLINREYGLEMKNPEAQTQIKYLSAGTLPIEYLLQVQGSMLVTGFDRWDFFSYYPGLPLFILEIRRDEKVITALKDALERFCDELEKLEENIRGKL